MAWSHFVGLGCVSPSLGAVLGRPFGHGGDLPEISDSPLRAVARQRSPCGAGKHQKACRPPASPNRSLWRASNSYRLAQAGDAGRVAGELGNPAPRFTAITARPSNSRTTQTPLETCPIFPAWFSNGRTSYRPATTLSDLHPPQFPNANCPPSSPPDVWMSRQFSTGATGRTGRCRRSQA